MGLATAPTAALSAVQPAEIGKASGANNTLPGSAGRSGWRSPPRCSPAAATWAARPARWNGIRPALYVTAGFALLAALSGLAIRPAAAPAAAAPGAAAPPAVETPAGPVPAAEPPAGPVSAR